MGEYPCDKCGAMLESAQKRINHKKRCGVAPGKRGRPAGTVASSSSSVMNVTEPVSDINRGSGIPDTGAAELIAVKERDSEEKRKAAFLLSITPPTLSWMKKLGDTPPK